MCLARIAPRCSSAAAAFLVELLRLFKVVLLCVRSWSSILHAPCSAKSLQVGHLAVAGQFLWVEQASAACSCLARTHPRVKVEMEVPGMHH